MFDVFKKKKTDDIFAGERRRAYAREALKLGKEQARKQGRAMARAKYGAKGGKKSTLDEATPMLEQFAEIVETKGTKKGKKKKGSSHQDLLNMI